MRRSVSYAERDRSNPFCELPATVHPGRLDVNTLSTQSVSFVSWQGLLCAQEAAPEVSRVRSPREKTQEVILRPLVCAVDTPHILDFMIGVHSAHVSRLESTE